MTTKTRLDFKGESLLSWCREDSNWPDEKMLYKKATEHQVMFVRDTLPKAYVSTQEEYNFATEDLGTQVIGTHISKSCDLPVYGLDIPSLGVRAVLSNNFYGWVVSIESPKPVDMSMFEGRISQEPCKPIYCSGFKEQWVLGTPAQNPCVFTVEMWSEYDLYALFMRLSHQLRAAK